MRRATRRGALADYDRISKEICGVLRLDEDGKVRAVISPGRIAVTLGYHLSRWTDQQRDRRGEQPFKDREEAGLHALLLSDRGIDHLSRDAA